MQRKQRKYNFFKRIGRLFRLNFIKLLRSPGGAKKVSLGFAIGFGLEMLVISTAALVYVLFIPIVKTFKASLPAAIIGNVIGKLTFLPVILLPFARKIGKMIYPTHVNVSSHGLLGIIHGGLHVLIGMSIFGVILGFASYFVVHYFYEKEKKRRLAKIHNKLKNS
jgi:EamA domain-containing membrane protein RarD